jgi:hypothetical protein
LKRHENLEFAELENPKFEKGNGKGVGNSSNENELGFWV